MPAADPAARVGIEDGHAVAASGEFAGENEDCRGLAGAALGIGKCQYWHIISFIKKGPSQVIAPNCSLGGMLPDGYL
ncbi:hypothetical protein D3C72_2498180 [compost metagenome]